MSRVKLRGSRVVIGRDRRGVVGNCECQPCQENCNVPCMGDYEYNGFYFFDPDTVDCYGRTGGDEFGEGESYAGGSWSFEGPFQTASSEQPLFFHNMVSAPPIDAPFVFEVGATAWPELLQDPTERGPLNLTGEATWRGSVDFTSMFNTSNLSCSAGIQKSWRYINADIGGLVQPTVFTFSLPGDNGATTFGQVTQPTQVGIRVTYDGSSILQYAAMRGGSAVFTKNVDVSGDSSFRICSGHTTRNSISWLNNDVGTTNEYFDGRYRVTLSGPAFGRYTY